MFNKHINCRQAIIFLFVHELFFNRRLVFKLQVSSGKALGRETLFFLLFICAGRCNPALFHATLSVPAVSLKLEACGF